MTQLSLLGVPTSAWSCAAGQEQAPRALRAAGLLAALDAADVRVADAGDVTEQIWAPDPDHLYAQNLDQVVASVRELTDRVPAPVGGDDRRLLVIGGNCPTGRSSRTSTWTCSTSSTPRSRRTPAVATSGPRSTSCARR